MDGGRWWNKYKSAAARKWRRLSARTQSRLCRAVCDCRCLRLSVSVLRFVCAKLRMVRVVLSATARLTVTALRLRISPGRRLWIVQPSCLAYAALSVLPTSTITDAQLQFLARHPASRASRRIKICIIIVVAYCTLHMYMREVMKSKRGIPIPVHRAEQYNNRDVRSQLGWASLVVTATSNGGRGGEWRVTGDG